MSRTTVLQIIAALITVVILFWVREALGVFLHSLDPKFMMGLVIGVMGTSGVFVVLLLLEQRRLATLARREQHRTRDIINL
ncbi:MAG: hypothetical protein E5V48_02575 [Mesorhizobium sp.]|nr:MAG: hypothetical protein E5V48_02575 [Mesorhizobium sp.]